MSLGDGDVEEPQLLKPRLPVELEIALLHEPPLCLDPAGWCGIYRLCLPSVLVQGLFGGNVWRGRQARWCLITR
jgi:hypothetical protein